LPESPKYLIVVVRRLLVTTFCGLALLIATVAYGLLVQPPITNIVDTLILVALLPSSTYIILLILGLTVPDLVGERLPRFPLNLTLPIVFGLVLMTTASLFQVMVPEIQMTPKAFEVVTMWNDIWHSAMAILINIVVLSALLAPFNMIQRRKPEAKS